MFKDIKNNLDTEVNKYARKNIIAKLQKQGIDHQQLADSDFEELLADEIEILKSDKKNRCRHWYRYFNKFSNWYIGVLSD